MSNLIDFPRADRPISERDVDELHAEAFRDLEGRLSDCVSMARIAAEKMPCDANGDAFFAVVHSVEMLVKLQKDYYRAYHGEKQGGFHTSSI
jgi:hypothetical protein